jgi:hypothetical protein
MTLPKDDKKTAIVFDTGRFREFEVKFKELQDSMIEVKRGQKVSSPSSKQPYIFMGLGMVLLVVISIVLLETLSPATRDNTSSILQIVGFAGTTTAALFAYQKSQDTHVMMNSKLDTWKEEFAEKMQERGKAAEAAAFSEGRKEGREDANARTDLLAGTVTKTE